MDWNKKGLMAQYKKGLKLKVLNALVLMEDPKNIQELINKVVKINNRIYQREQANKGHNKQVQTQVHKLFQQTSRQWYGGPELIDLSDTKEIQKDNNRNRS